MAAAAGVNLGQVVRVSDVTFSGYQSPSFGLKSAAADTQVPLGELNLTVTVEVVYAIV
jgi:uncharacterized protein YggE